MTGPVLEMNPIVQGRLEAQLQSISIIRPVIVRQIPDQHVGLLEVVSGPFLELIKKVKYAAVVMVVLGVVIVVTCCGARENAFVEVDFALDEREQLFKMPGQLLESDGLCKRFHACV